MKKLITRVSAMVAIVISTVLAVLMLLLVPVINVIFDTDQTLKENLKEVVGMIKHSYKNLFTVLHTGCKV